MFFAFFSYVQAFPFSIVLHYAFMIIYNTLGINFAKQYKLITYKYFIRVSYYYYYHVITETEIALNNIIY